MQEPELEFISDDSLAGFRLQRLELFNWGTFHDRIWTLQLNGRNALLTGDIGSGKSTLVDAVTTLLVPPQRIAYNKAAGADTRERTLRSYVLGYYKTERGEAGFSAKPVALREPGGYSVVVGVFRNNAYNQDVTLAQVFWHRDSVGQPSRFYIAAAGDFSIAADFARKGSDLSQVRKRLRNTEGVELFDSFPPYAASFRRRFGIESEQALDLFHQTVSMKSVGNLTDFVRGHMLETADVQPRIEALITHFDDLNRAHESVLKAKQQINRLTPIVSDCAVHDNKIKERADWCQCREGLRVYFAHLKTELLEKRLKKLSDEQARLSAKLESLKIIRQAQFVDRDKIKQAIAENGGDRIERISAEIKDKTRDKEKRQERADRYLELTRRAGFEGGLSQEAFTENRIRLESQIIDLETHEAAIQNAITENTVKFRGLKTQHDSLSSELASLRERRSNIDSKQIAMRRLLCDALNLDEKSMPFAGELIQVKDECSAWEGAAERLLHNFGLSLLVPDRQYIAVSDWVNQTHLQGRLVYFRVKTDNYGYASMDLHPDSLIRKLAVKPDSEFYPWLETELSKRFDYVCCETLEQFRREQQAVTMAGQVKSGGHRHEKDDRHRIDDRSRFILGWSNEPKIAALEKQATRLEKEMQSVATLISQAQKEYKKTAEQKTSLEKLAEFQDFADLDWHSLARVIATLCSEKEALETASNILAELGKQLATLESAIIENENSLDALHGDQGKNEAKLQLCMSEAALCRTTVETIPENERNALFEKLEPLREEALKGQALTIESAENREQEMRGWLQGKINSLDNQLKEIHERIIKAMQDYRRDFPLETQETDATLEAGHEFSVMLSRLQADDLPRFEKRFKELLNENTIREVAHFQSSLNRERQTIKERIDSINRSLADIEYNPGRFIRLETEPHPDSDVREFQQQLRACTEGMLTGTADEQYAESKYLQVRSIIEKFRGREGSTDLDLRWTRKVTDVRNWFVFAASERWKEDGTEHEHYTDSGGKSGGQKEKLAYTVLAASLAYQFGLEWGAIRSHNFRFVMIDEAFGRGSDESTRYALELFKKLNLQLLIVTPLQKIHIIEPYVAGVGFVHNEAGRESMLRNLTIEEYRAEREARGQ